MPTWSPLRRRSAQSRSPAVTTVNENQCPEARVAVVRELPRGENRHPATPTARPPARLAGGGACGSPAPATSTPDPGRVNGRPGTRRGDERRHRLTGTVSEWMSSRAVMGRPREREIDQPLVRTGAVRRLRFALAVVLAVAAVATVFLASDLAQPRPVVGRPGGTALPPTPAPYVVMRSAEVTAPGDGARDRGQCRLRVPPLPARPPGARGEGWHPGRPSTGRSGRRAGLVVVHATGGGVRRPPGGAPVRLLPAGAGPRRGRRRVSAVVGDRPAQADSAQRGCAHHPDFRPGTGGAAAGPRRVLHRAGRAHPGLTVRVAGRRTRNADRCARARSSTSRWCRCWRRHCCGGAGGPLTSCWRWCSCRRRC